MNPVITAEHHGEGIVEFHSTVPGPAFTWKGAILLVLPACFCVIVVWTMHVASGWSLLFLWSALIFGAIWRKTGQVQKESLLLIQDLGIQMFFSSVAFLSYGFPAQVKRSYVSGKEDRMFVERSRLCSVIINEGVGFSAVTYYLAFITKGDSELVLAFSDLIPRIHDLIVIFHATRSVMFGEDLPDGQSAAAFLHDSGSSGSRPPASRQLFGLSAAPDNSSLFAATDDDKKIQ